jgi:hypothetical protein
MRIDIQAIEHAEILIQAFGSVPSWPEEGCLVYRNPDDLFPVYVNAMEQAYRPNRTNKIMCINAYVAALSRARMACLTRS